MADNQEPATGTGGAALRRDLGPAKYEFGRRLAEIHFHASTWEDAAEQAAALFVPDAPAPSAVPERAAGGTSYKIPADKEHTLALAIHLAIQGDSAMLDRFVAEAKGSASVPEPERAAGGGGVPASSDDWYDRNPEIHKAMVELVSWAGAAGVRYGASSYTRIPATFTEAGEWIDERITNLRVAIDRARLAQPRPAAGGEGDAAPIFSPPLEAALLASSNATFACGGYRSDDDDDDGYGHLLLESTHRDRALRRAIRAEIDDAPGRVDAGAVREALHSADDALAGASAALRCLASTGMSDTQAIITGARDQIRAALDVALDRAGEGSNNPEKPESCPSPTAPTTSTEVSP